MSYIGELEKLTDYIDHELLHETKSYLKIEHDNDDNVLRKILNGVISDIERYTGKAVFHNDWNILIKDCITNTILLPLSPIRRIKEVRIEGAYINKETVKKEHYKVVENVLHFNISFWYSNIRIIFTAGYKKSSKLDSAMHNNIIKTAANLYENRDQNSKLSLSSYKGFMTLRF